LLLSATFMDSTLVGSHSHNTSMNFRCIQNWKPLMMGQMPLQVNGEFRCGGEMEFKGKNNGC